MGMCIVCVPIIEAPNFHSLRGSVLKFVLFKVAIHLASCSNLMLLLMSVLSCCIWARVLGVQGRDLRWFLFLISVFVALLNVGL